MKNRKIIAMILSVCACFLMCSCDGDTSNGGSATRDYYDKNDARNTDGHYDDGEYREALGEAKKVWDDQTK